MCMVTYLCDFKMDGVDMMYLALVLANIGFAYIVGKRRMRRKRVRSCWAHDWLLERENPAKRTMIHLYSEWFEVRYYVPKKGFEIKFNNRQHKILFKFTLI